MANDLSSGQNGSVPAERGLSQDRSFEHRSPADGAQAGVRTQAFVFNDTQAQAEAAARIADKSLEVPNLPKELAQLLAASIAQQGQISAGNSSSGQPARGLEAPARVAASTAPSALPQVSVVGGNGLQTNAELASLSSIMAGTQSVRKPLPRFRDELATLSYARTQSQTLAQSLAQVAPEASSHDGMRDPGSVGTSGHNGYPSGSMSPASLSMSHPDDEPMPIPSTWREKAQDDDDRPMARQLGAAAMGLAAGLVVVVPAVLYLVGWIGPNGGRGDSTAFTPRGSERPFNIRPIERPAESATFYSNETPGSPASDAGPVTTASMARVPVIDPSQQIEQVLVMARQKIDSGDIPAARDLLGADDASSAALTFALAETFDPNMLAAWGSRGVTADVQRARALYTKALDLGYGRAMSRLDALQ